MSIHNTEKLPFLLRDKNRGVAKGERRGRSAPGDTFMGAELWAAP